MTCGDEEEKDSKDLQKEGFVAASFLSSSWLNSHSDHHDHNHDDHQYDYDCDHSDDHDDHERFKRFAKGRFCRCQLLIGMAEH